MTRHNSHKASRPTAHALRVLLGVAFLCLTLLPFSVSAETPPKKSACKPGVPCDTPLTPNDPTKPDDGPNATGSPNAAQSDTAGCDADFMNQISGRAFLEAEREMVSANATIVKPDSILEYSCFDQIAANASKKQGPLFGESDRWHNVDVDTGDGNTKLNAYLGKKDLDRQVESVVLGTLDGYVKDSFSHDFMGGVNSGEDSNISKTVDGAGKVCDSMYNVYHVAQCSDFGLEAPFMTFEALTSTDPRSQPETCGSTHGVTQKMIDLAKNKDFKYSAVDKVQTYLSKTRADGKTCDDPVPTGLTVNHAERGQDLAGHPTTDDKYTYQDKICPNPGCYLDTKGEKCLPRE